MHVNVCMWWVMCVGCGMGVASCMFLCAECSVFFRRHENGSVKFWDITDGKFHADMSKVCMN